MIPAPPVPAPLRWVLAAYLAAALACAFGVESFCQDEGYYALAAKHVTNGLSPYADFAYPQMPLLPYVYAAWFKVFGASIESGRLLSILLSATGTAFMMETCRRLGGTAAAVMAGALMIASVYTCADLATIKTQALCHALASASVFAVACAPASSKASWWAAGLLLMSLAFLTRLTFIVPLLGLWAYVLWQSRSNKLLGLALVGGNAILLLACVRWFWADGNLAFGTYYLHRDHLGAGPWTWERLRWTMKYAIGNQFVLMFLFLIASGVFTREMIRGKRPGHQELAAWLLYSYVGSTLLHWSTVQNYPTHQTPITCFAVVFTMLVLAPFIRVAWEQQPAATVGAFVLGALLATPFSEYSVIDAVLASTRGLRGVNEAVRILASRVAPGSRLLTFNDELAVNGNYRVVPGCDMYHFAYVPGMDDEAAARHHVLTLNGVRKAIESSDTAAIAVTDRDFAIMAAGNDEIAKGLKQAIDERFHAVGVVRQYGQFGLDLFIFKRMVGPSSGPDAR